MDIIKLEFELNKFLEWYEKHRLMYQNINYTLQQIVSYYLISTTK